jgi:ankyrin repeat protein
MEVLLYNELDYSKIKKKFDKVLGFLKKGEFKSADVKKMVNTGFYRAKLDDTNRLLFQYIKVDDKKYLLLLEVIYNHAYEKSRFLNGASFDENDFEAVTKDDDFTEEKKSRINYLNPKQKHFNILDKILSFDDIQHEVFNLPSPVIIIGSAGSGKTAITLEKMKTLQGRVLYTTLSAFLVENSHNVYYAFDYDNPKQEVDFMSFKEYLSSIEIPKGKEIHFKDFERWIWRFKQSHKVKDAYKVFEEFKGVLTGSVIDKPYLSKEDYLDLGVKQSIFLKDEREKIYDLFEKYVEFLNEEGYYDSNIVAFKHLSKVKPSYDFVVIDEVQDITNVQLYLILSALHVNTNFILCGDSNQIVHPNFFSWTNIKTLFYKKELEGNIIRVLATNYRNTPEVTGIANQLLLIKNARFGSIDKESTYLVKSNSQNTGEVEYLENKEKTLKDLNQRTQRSAKFAVIVMRNEDKDRAKKYFKTPLLFSIHEVKGLEYENIILFDIISSYQKEFKELTNGVSKEDIQKEEITYSRAKDKSDKALDEYKFYVNALYVAMTRAINNLYVIESNKKHELLELLDLTDFSKEVKLKEQSSSTEEWQKEARKLEMQGKQEQADAIRDQVLKIKEVPWEIITSKRLKELYEEAFNPEHFNKKAKDSIFEYHLFYNEEPLLKKLSELKYRAADEDRRYQETSKMERKKFQIYEKDDVKQLQDLTKQYGLDFRNEFNLTSLMIAVIYDSTKIFEFLIKNEAKIDKVDNFGRTILNLLLNNVRKESTVKNTNKKANQKQKEKLNKYYKKIKSNSIALKVDNKYIKIESHQAEYLMLNLMIGVFRDLVIDTTSTLHFYPAYESQDFFTTFENLSQQVLPSYRQKRSYISSILAKNEIFSTSPYNKGLWLRLQRGYYILNPKMEILDENDNWINIYTFLGIDSLKENINPNHRFFEDYKNGWKNILEKGNTQ